MSAPQPVTICSIVYDGRARAASTGFPARQTYVTDMENAPSPYFLNANSAVRNFAVGHFACYVGKIGLPIRFHDRNMRGRHQRSIAADTAALRLYRPHGHQPTPCITPFRMWWAHLPRYQVLGRIVGVPSMGRLAAMACDNAQAPRLHRWHLQLVGRAGR